MYNGEGLLVFHSLYLFIVCTFIEVTAQGADSQYGLEDSFVAAAAAPQILPLSPVPVACIRPVPLLGVSVCLAQSYDSLVSSQGSEDTNYNSISFPRNHCARG